MLKEKLIAMVEQSAKKIPQAARNVMATATQSVADSIPGRKLPKIGDPLPLFELVDSTGQMQSTEGLLSDNKIILTFFRGGW